MSLATQLDELKYSLSPNCKILTNPNDLEFVEYLRRWTDVNLQVPGAIILPTKENDCQKIVQWAHKLSIPFVPKSGGHSEWSTTGPHGIIIDLSLYKSVSVNREAQTATLTGCLLSKEVGVALADVGLFTGTLFQTLGNGNTVGAIPYFLNGGASITSSITGFGSDQIVSARLITATGELISVSTVSHPELLYAIRGAGQFFGLVTQLVVKAYPLSALGNERGEIWAGAFVFPLERAGEVVAVTEELMADGTYATAGMMMIMALPPLRTPSLAISARYTGDPNYASEAFKPLYALNPVVTSGSAVPIQNASDCHEVLGAKRRFKRFGVVGLHRFDAGTFLKTVGLWREMVGKCPDAVGSKFNFQWDSRPVRKMGFESAMCLHDIRYWQNNVIWRTDPKNQEKVDEYNDRCIAVMRGGDESAFVDFQNGTREGPIGRRFRGEDRLAKLSSLKKEWDPEGVFTRELLD